MDRALKRTLRRRISQGVPLDSLNPSRSSLSTSLTSFIETGFSTFLFLTGHPGCGKTFSLRMAIDSLSLRDCWCSTIDCRLFLNDRAACKEFFRLHGQPANTPILDALRSIGTGILIFDHFESLKIVKRQFFLYTLFDSIHTNAVSLCVVLVTSSHEPLNNLEKRVRSRFTPTCVEFPRPIGDASFVIQLLSTENAEWNAAVAAAFFGVDLSPLFDLSQSLQTVVTFTKTLVITVSEGEVIGRGHVEQAIAQMLSVIHPDRFIAALSQMEVLILIVCCYLVRIRYYTELTFDTVYSEMMAQLIESSFVKKMTPERAHVAWEKAMALRLLVRPGKDVTKVALAVFEEDVLLAVDRLPTEIAAWARKWM
jgi:hypothetical protein